MEAMQPHEAVSHAHRTNNADVLHVRVDQLPSASPAARDQQTALLALNRLGYERQRQPVLHEPGAAEHVWEYYKAY